MQQGAVGQANSAQFLGPEEPAPFQVYNPGSDRPVLIACDHASNVVPRALGDLGLAEHYRNDHIAWDIGAAGVTHIVADRLNATAVLAGYSRLVVDLNRQLHDPTSMPALSDGILVTGNLGLTPEQRGRRVDALFRPYHDAVAAEIERLSRHGAAPALITIHSFTPYLHGVFRPWDIGVLWADDARLPVPFMHWLRINTDLMIGDNVPYSGRHPADYTIDWHAERPGLAHVGIEVRQDHIVHRDGQERFANILADQLAIVLQDDRLYGG